MRGCLQCYMWGWMDGWDGIGWLSYVKGILIQSNYWISICVSQKLQAQQAFTSTKYIIKVNHDTFYKDGFGNNMKIAKLFWRLLNGVQLFLVFYSGLKKQAVRPAAFWRTALIVRQPWKAPKHNVLFEQNVFLPTEQAQIYPEIHVSKYHSTFVPGCSHGRKTWFSRKLWIPNSESAISCII